MKSNIVFFTLTGEYPDSQGGPAIHLYLLRSRLNALGVSSHLFDFNNRQKSNLVTNMLIAMKNVITSNLIVFNSPPAGVLTFFSVLAKVFRKKSLFICHGGIFFEADGLINGLTRSSVLFQLKTGIVKYTVFPSRSLASFAEKYNLRSQKFVIHNSVDIYEINSAPSRKIVTRNNLLFVGRLARIKGIRELIISFSQLVDVSCNLYIVGSNESLKQYEFESLKNLPGVHYCDGLAHEEVISLMKSIDIVVVPSLMETFSLVTIEAMACGKPVIATNVGAIPEIIKNGYNGILIPSKDAKALSQAILFLINNPLEAERLGKNARGTIQRFFTLDVMIQKYLSIFNGDCSQPNNPLRFEEKKSLLGSKEKR